MKEGPDISLIGSLIGDPARANMLAALMSGKALTATELAAEAGISNSTASAHLKRLEEGDLIIQRKQGRHRYFTLADDDVGGVLEAIMGLAAKRGHLRSQTGPKDPALRLARVCYDHLAGELAVQMFDSLSQRGLIEGTDDNIALTTAGRDFVSDFGIELEILEQAKRPVCKSCLDWSVRRSHLAGALGAAFLQQFHDRTWARREQNTRVVRFSPNGLIAFKQVFALS